MGLVKRLLRALPVPPQVVQVTEKVKSVALPAPVTDVDDQLEG